VQCTKIILTVSSNLKMFFSFYLFCICSNVFAGTGNTEKCLKNEFFFRGCSLWLHILYFQNPT
jgi:hypothetical protein